MRIDEYLSLDGVAMAAAVRAGDVTADELLDCAIRRADQVDGGINSIATRLDSLARKRSAEPLTGPFAGVPFLIKDLGQELAGTVTGSGSRGAVSAPDSENSDVVQRWLDAGVVIFGKTTSSEFGTKAVTETAAHGITRNPWNRGRTPGGSSGGAGAAVAAGIVPIAGASDGGGSIRIPAACCGLVGLKPSRGLVPAGPDHAEIVLGLGTAGVVSRTVRDSAAMLDVLTATNSPTAPYAGARASTPYADSVGTQSTPLRIGYTTTSPIDTPVSAEAVSAVAAAASFLNQLGHHVDDAHADIAAIDGHGAIGDWLTIWSGYVAATIDNLVAHAGSSFRDFELDNRLLAAAGRAVSASDYFAVLERCQRYTRQLAAVHQKYDLVLTPTIAEPAIAVGAVDLPSPIRRAAELALRARMVGPFSRTALWQRQIITNLSPVPFTQLANITGRPAISLPTYHTADGLPLGIQLTGPLGSEPILLSVAADLENLTQWVERKPSL